MAHYLLDAYAQSMGYLDGVRANPADPTRVVEALATVCEALGRLAREDDLWTDLEVLLAAHAEVPAAEETDEAVEQFLDKELEYLVADMGDVDTARRLLDDLGTLIQRADYDADAIGDLRDVTGRVRDSVCRERTTLEEAIAANNAGWRSRFRSLRIAIIGTVFVGGAGVLVLDGTVVIAGDPVTGVASMKFGIAGMLASWRSLLAEIG